MEYDKMNKKKLLILGSSYRRKSDPEPMPAIERYDGVFYRVARKYLPKKNIEVTILTDDLQLISGSKKILYTPPTPWAGSTKINYNSDYIEKRLISNKELLRKMCRDEDFDEIFVAIGIIYRRALPNFDEFNCKVILPRGGLGPTAKSLKEWLQES